MIFSIIFFGGGESSDTKCGDSEIRNLISFTPGEWRAMKTGATENVIHNIFCKFTDIINIYRRIFEKVHLPPSVKFCLAWRMPAQTPERIFEMFHRLIVKCILFVGTEMVYYNFGFIYFRSRVLQQYIL